MRALLCPGQGAQKPGMLSAWLPGAAGAEAQAAQEVLTLVRAASEQTGLDLLRLGTQAYAAEIRDTAVAQPLIVLASLASAIHHGLLLDDEGAQRASGQLAASDGSGDAVAGHSLGALTALALAGVLTPLEAVTLAAKRGAAMAQCCRIGEPGGMTALLGGDRAAVLAAVEAAGLYAANINGATQLVAAGTLSALDGFQAPVGVRTVRLEVAGAFHCPAMAPAASMLTQAVEELPERVLRRTIIDEATGEVHPVGSSGRELLTGLIAHLTAPVRWDLVQEQLLRLGVTEAVELAPAGTLAGFARRDLPGITVTRLRAPAVV
ncbi:Malonyl CoA-acyl carrier protein transacylase [Actinomyces bovis]|uniref:[acyl-carrier-protein] S-malonyltransferase n=1 Tax=Actinomyces bovis TaxID=1658 RepID=A0ABY1VPT2_9ACTO|nr:ACP S-malonyltransferase [Actinomyces bovis]SPT54139.1 Malonyl CoA-acyl carrier protein transacylase [Actinomyces bovis]VEG53613.1 Malonyl CoA-acyl carrier protein transacylase [Actinomyces israelii]